MMVTIVLSLMTTALFSSFANAEEISVSRFAAEGLTGWESKSFKGTTEYHLLNVNGRTVVRASSRNSASGLIRKIRFQPSKYRYLRWSWMISHTVKGGDEMSRSGDDYAARVYVVFPGHYFWQMKAINYIWANTLVKGSSVSSVYASDSKMVAVESGNAKAGQWIAEERDLLADYRLLFGTDPPEAEAIAIMTDTDNTGGSAEAWYGDVIISTEKR